MPWFTKIKKEEGKFRLFRPYSRPFPACFGRFRPVSVVSATSRYDPIWSIRPDFGRISLVQHESKPIQHESKPIQHESSCIGANWAASMQIKPSRRESEKKKKKADTDRHAGNRIGRRVPRRTRVRHLWCHVRAFYPISKYLTPYAEKFDSLLNLHASSRLLQSFMI